MRTKKIISILFALALILASALLLAACNPGGGNSNPGSIPTFNYVEVARIGTDYVDTENTVCITMSEKDEVVTCETVMVNVHLLNSGGTAITSLKVNGEVFKDGTDSDVFFTKDAKYTKLSMRYTPKAEEAGLYEIKVTDIYYKSGASVSAISRLENNTVDINVAPTLKLTVVAKDPVTGEELLRKTESGGFMEPLTSFSNLYTDAQMSYEKDASASLGYCPVNYGFAGWFLSEMADARAVTRADKFEFYTDITLYAKFVTQFAYTTVTDTETEETYAVAGRLNEVGKNVTGTLTVYDTVDGYPIKKIGQEAFSAANARIIVLSDNIQEIGTGAFSGFGGRVVLGSNVRVIGRRAFYNCTGLNRFYIPSSVEEIGDEAFKNSTWDTYTQDDAVVEAASGGVLQKTTLIVPVNVKKIGASAFENTGFTAVYFLYGSAIEEVGVAAFKNATSLATVKTSVVIQSGSVFRTVPADENGRGLTLISDDMFRGCSAIKTLELAEGLLTIGTYAFQTEAMPLTALTIPASVTDIGEYAFINFKKATSITFAADSQLRVLGKCAFASSVVTTLKFTSKVLQTYGESPFYLNNNLRVLEFVGETPPMFQEKAALQGVNEQYIKYLVPEASLAAYQNEFYIQKGAFGYYTKYPLRVYPREMQYADMNGSFNSNVYGYEIVDGANVRILYVIENGDKESETVSYPATFQIGDDTYTVTALGQFVANETVKSVRLPVTLTEIGDNAFYNCGSLTQVGVGSYQSTPQWGFENLTNLTRIGKNAFCYSGITTFVAPASITAIDKAAFQQCLSLTEVRVMPNAETTIFADAFAQCYALERVRLGAMVKYLGDGAFADCKRLTWIYIHSHTAPRIPSGSFIVGPFKGVGTEKPTGWTSAEEWSTGSWKIYILGGKDDFVSYWQSSFGYGSHYEIFM